VAGHSRQFNRGRSIAGTLFVGRQFVESTEISFELEILWSTSCTIFGFDASIDNISGIPPELQHRIHFTQKFLGTENSPEEFITWSKAMELNGHTHIDILKLDVAKNTK